MGDKVSDQEMINVEVAIALPHHQEIRELAVNRGCTALEAAELSGLLARYGEYLVPGEEPALGIFSRPLNGVELPRPGEYVLANHDRVEIYRPLENDPKQARRKRAQMKKKSTS